MWNGHGKLRNEKLRIKGRDEGVEKQKPQVILRLFEFAVTGIIGDNKAAGQPIGTKWSRARDTNYFVF